MVGSGAGWHSKWRGSWRCDGTMEEDEECKGGVLGRYVVHSKGSRRPSGRAHRVFAAGDASDTTAAPVNHAIAPVDQAGEPSVRVSAPSKQAHEQPSAPTNQARDQASTLREQARKVGYGDGWGDSLCLALWDGTCERDGSSAVRVRIKLKLHSRLQSTRTKGG